MNNWKLLEHFKVQKNQLNAIELIVKIYQTFKLQETTRLQQTKLQ